MFEIMAVITVWMVLDPSVYLAKDLTTFELYELS